MEEIDVLIIGAGPAGVSTAMHLLQSDPLWSGRMVIIEKAVHPRDKLCGGGLTQLSFIVLQSLGINLPLSIPGVEINDVRLAFRGRTIHVRGKREFVVYHRPEFDAYLVKEARGRGIEIREGETVLDLLFDENCVLVKTDQNTYQAKVVVGADGSKGITRRVFNPSDPNRCVARLLGLRGNGESQAKHFSENYALLDFSPVVENLQGYYWEFPCRIDGKDFINYGVYDSRIYSSRKLASLREIFTRNLISQKIDPDQVQIEGHPIHLFTPRNPMSCPHLILVGDAIGAEPILGEGIAPALACGKIASEAITEAFIGNEFSFANYRGKILSSTIGGFLTERWMIAKFLYRFIRSPLIMHGFWTLGTFVEKTILRQSLP